MTTDPQVQRELDQLKIAYIKLESRIAFIERQYNRTEPRIRALERLVERLAERLNR
jgi:hypothetical protein